MIINFSVGNKENMEISKLISLASGIKCKIKIDLKNGLVTTEFNNSGDIDKVIDLIDEFFNINTIDIVNVEEKKRNELSNQEKNEKYIKPTNYKTFDDEDAEYALKRLVQTAQYLIKNKKTDASVLARYLRTIKTEMSLNTTDDDKVIEFKEGDIVETFYGMHLTGEAVGENSYAIVCKKIGKSAFLVPLPTLNRQEAGHMVFDDGKDLTYFANAKYKATKRGLISKMGRFLNSKRVISVVGKMNEEAFDRVLRDLSNRYSFFCKFEDENSEITSNMVDNIENTENTENTESKKKSHAEKLREYLAGKIEKGMKSFTAEELRIRFPEIKSTTIASFIYKAKNDGAIVATKKKGGYKIINIQINSKTKK